MHIRRMFYVSYFKVKTCALLKVAKIDEKERETCIKLIKNMEISALKLISYIIWTKLQQRKSSHKTK